MKTPSTKLQAPEKLQSPNIKVLGWLATRALMLGAGCLFGVWFLMLGASTAHSAEATNPPPRRFFAPQPISPEVAADRRTPPT
jgi:hypothetical protein